MTSSNNSSTPDTPEGRAVERQVAALLTTYAEGMPPTAGIEARLRERLATTSVPDAAPRARWLPTRIGAPRSAGGWARGLVSLVLVAALIAGFVGVAWLRHTAPGTGNGSMSGPCTEIAGAGENGLPNICPAGNVEPTFEALQSYADPTRTALQFHVAVPGTVIPHGRPIIYSPPDGITITEATLQDSQGRLYNGPDGGTSAIPPRQVAATMTLEFSPLPQDALNTSQTLTLHISHMMLQYQDFLTYLSGSWTVPFQVRPQAGRSISFQISPQKHNGIKVQPLRLDVGPTDGGFDGEGGGERLILRISGLDPQASLLGLRGFDIAAHFPDGSGWSASHGPKLLFEGRPPASIVGAGVDPNAVVGPTGTIDMEIIFIGPPLTSLTGVQKLTIDQLVVSLDPKTTLPTKTVKGPWVFQLPLS
ncbi:MAG TPA: hypothetical protein VFQ25_06525 [Ktedonobacterales bacterium]|nr:hypothetical protein [Ktedonobacterales bacterium]